jgi:hypothetical protein
MQQRARSWFISAVLVVIGVIVGYLLPQNNVSPRSEVGKVVSVHGSIGGAKAGIYFKTKGVKGLIRYALENPTPWQASPNAKWHFSGQPSCLKPGSRTPVKVTLGVITVKPVNSAPGSLMVVWIECYT